MSPEADSLFMYPLPFEALSRGLPSRGLGGIARG